MSSAGAMQKLLLAVLLVAVVQQIGWASSSDLDQGLFPTDSIATLIASDSLMDRVLELQDIHLADSAIGPINEERDWLISRLLSYGYSDITLQEFTIAADTFYNILVVKPGYAEPDRNIVVGANYDSRVAEWIVLDPDPQWFRFYGPGANENGTGVAAALEIARVMQSVSCRKSIVFAFFAAGGLNNEGAELCAETFAANETDIEIMYDLHVLGDIFSGQFPCMLSDNQLAYSRSLSEAYLRLFPGSTPPEIGDRLRSHYDAWKFGTSGFKSLHFTNNPDYAGRNPEDDTDELVVFSLLTTLTKTAAASILHVANMAPLADIDAVYDMGTGHSVRVDLKDCDLSLPHKILYGDASYGYTDTVNVDQGECSVVVDNLLEGVTYYFSAVAYADTLLQSTPETEYTADSYLNPRMPGAFVGAPVLDANKLDWNANAELDFSHFRVYRRGPNESTFTLYQDNILDTFYVDQNAERREEYAYRVAAVDFDLFESDLSDSTNLIPAFFDAGVLVVDETQAVYGIPDEDTQRDFYRSLFSDLSIDMVRLDDEINLLTRNRLGQYSSIFYFDDEFPLNKYLSFSGDSLAWYVNFENNFLLSGFRTIEYWANSPELPLDHPLRTDFGLERYEVNFAQEFVGAKGVNGWPDLAVNPANPIGNLPLIPTLEPVPGAEVIYTYDSNTDDPALEGKPCGLLFHTNGGTRILLSFPVYHLYPSSATALITHAQAVFNETALFAAGDINMNGAINIADLTYLIDYLFGVPSGPIPSDPDLADVNGSCAVNISDVTYLIAYLYGVPTGPAPQRGCAEL